MKIRIAFSLFFFSRAIRAFLFLLHLSSPYEYRNGIFGIGSEPHGTPVPSRCPALHLEEVCPGGRPLLLKALVDGRRDPPTPSPSGGGGARCPSDGSGPCAQHARLNAIYVSVPSFPSNTSPAGMPRPPPSGGGTQIHKWTTGHSIGASGEWDSPALPCECHPHLKIRVIVSPPPLPKQSHQPSHLSKPSQCPPPPLCWSHVPLAQEGRRGRGFILIRCRAPPPKGPQIRTCAAHWAMGIPNQVLPLHGQPGFLMLAKRRGDTEYLFWQNRG